MISDVVVSRYGASASDELARVVAQAQAGSPLAPVTVVVGSNFAGLVARRRLGTVGVANVGFLTAFRLAELLAADRLLGRRALTNPVLGAAVRRALAESPGPFRRVRDHVATETAVAALYAELSNVTPAARAHMAASGRRAAVEALALHSAIADRLGDVHDEADLARAAAERPDLAQALVPYGTVVWFLPEPMTAPLADFTRAVLAAAPSQVIVGLTGDEVADAAVRHVLARVGVETPFEGPSGPVATADAIVSVTDADEEVRVIIRKILGLAAAGVPLDRIGVFHPTPDPYIGILEQQFAAAGIPANGPSRRRLLDTVAGRTLLAALALPAQRWRRDRVMALVAGAPLRVGDRPARPSAMERTSRDAGVVQDLADWRRKLAARRALLDGRVASASTSAVLEQLQRRIADVDELDAFVEGLAAMVHAVESAQGWAARAAAAVELLHGLLGGDHLHERWPEGERRAFERVEDALSRLAALDELEPGAGQRVFIAALTAELDVPVGRNGRFGDGVTYGPLSAAVGHDLDAVFLLGCAEGLCPSVRRDDAMLPDSVRQLAGGELALRSEQLADQHRWFLAALEAAPSGRRTLLFPRGDLRSSRESLPSRWLLDTASALQRTSVHSTTFLEHPPACVEVVHSHRHGIATAQVHASAEERDAAVVLGSFARGELDPSSPEVAPVATALAAQHARRSAHFTEWDGNLAGQSIPSTADRPLSPTSLQDWASCGLRYFFAKVLELSDRDDPERILELSPIDRGTVVHVALERFFEEVIESGAPRPDEPWSTEQRARLRTLAEECLDEVEQRGRTGRPVHWKLTRDDVLVLLDRFLDADQEHRASRGMVPTRVELPFGLEDREPVVLELADGRRLAFRGKADRVDVGADGRYMVLDYKTGSGAKYEGLEDDPVQGGATLQLGLYAEAARQHLGADAVDAAYWIVDDRAKYARRGYPWTDDRRERMLEVVTAIADGIEGGVFPAQPGEWNNWRRTHQQCVYCEFDQICSIDRGEQAAAKAGAPELAVRAVLTPPEPSECGEATP